MHKAAEADAGFDLDIFTQALRSHRRLNDADFPNVGVAITEIRAYFDTWANELDERG